MSPEGLQDGPRCVQDGRWKWNVARRWQKMAQEALQMRRRWPNVVPRCAQDGPRRPYGRLKLGPREARDGQIFLQNGRKIGEDEVKMGKMKRKSILSKNGQKPKENLGFCSV